MVDMVKVKLVKTSIDLGVDSVHTPELVAKVMKDYMEEHCNTDRENMVVLGVDINFKIHAIHTLSIGDSRSMQFSMLEIFRVCLLSNSQGFFLAHNHPTGEVEPSDTDIETTHVIQQGAKTMGLNMLDHIIIGDREVYSMKVNGDLTD